MSVGIAQMEMSLAQTAFLGSEGLSSFAFR